MASQLVHLHLISDEELQRVAEMALQVCRPVNPWQEADLEEQRRRSMDDLSQLQKRSDGWGLTKPLLQHPNPTVRSFGAHASKIKIERDWDSLPHFLQTGLLEQNLRFTCEAASPTSPYHGENKMIVETMFGSLAGLILRLTPRKFLNPVSKVVTELRDSHAPLIDVLEWLQIAADVLSRSSLEETREAEISAAITREIPFIVKTITETLSEKGRGSSQEEEDEETVAAFRCLESWVMWGISLADMPDLLPVLYDLLNTPLMIRSIHATVKILETVDDADDQTALLTEQLLRWTAQLKLDFINQEIRENGTASETLHAINSLVHALLEHLATWITKQVHTYIPRAGSLVDTGNLVTLFIVLRGFPQLRDVDVGEHTQSLLPALHQRCMTLVDLSAFSTSVASEISKALWCQSISKSDLGRFMSLAESQEGEQMDDCDQKI